MTAPRPSAQTDDSRTGMSSRNETIAGLVLIGLSLVAALAIGLHPGRNVLDHWGFSVLPRSPHSTFLRRIADLGGLPVLVGGSVLAALVVIGEDRRRAIACLGGPLIAAVLVEWVMKPLVGRRYLGVLCFPSGSVAVVAAVSTSWVLAVPRWLRWAAIVIGVGLVSLMSVAVIAVRWHYPSDALAGASIAVGVVLLCDGLLHLHEREQTRQPVGHIRGLRI
jgi:membrane-associated phospholipid phosphatase